MGEFLLKALLKILSVFVFIAVLASCSIPRGDADSQANESNTSSDLAQSSFDSDSKTSSEYENYFSQEHPYEDLSLVSEVSKQNAVIIEENGNLAVVPFDDYREKNFANKTVLFDKEAVANYDVVNDKIFFITASNIIYETDFRGENTGKIFELESKDNQNVKNFFANDSLIWFSLEHTVYRLYVPDKKLDELYTNEDMISFVPVSNYAIKYSVYSQQYKDFIAAGNDPDDVFFSECDYYVFNSQTRESTPASQSD